MDVAAAQMIDDNINHAPEMFEQTLIGNQGVTSQNQPLFECIVFPGTEVM